MKLYGLLFALNVALVAAYEASLRASSTEEGEERELQVVRGFLGLLLQPFFGLFGLLCTFLPFLPFCPAVLSPSDTSSVSDDPLIARLSKFTDPKLFLDETTPQFQALSFLANENFVTLEEDPLEVDSRYLLALLYFSTNGESWTQQNNFLTRASVCQWFSPGTDQGAGCDDANQVVFLNLSSNNLQGTLPRELFLLTALRFVIFRLNSGLIGSIPDTIGFATGLQDLSFAANSLTGTIPPEVGNLSVLRFFEVGGNSLTGSIPDVLTKINTIARLAADRNKLTGTIPEFSAGGALTTLDLGVNQLSGTLPESIITKPLLQSLSLGTNKLTGTLPTTLGTVSTLKSLGLDQNSFAGTIPTEFGNLTSLTRVSLKSNNLTGSIPTELGLLVNLELLFLGGNSFTPVPPAEVDALNIPTTDF